MDIYSIDTEIPLIRTLSHKGRGNFPSLDFVVSSVERWEELREDNMFLCSFVSLWLMRIHLVLAQITAEIISMNLFISQLIHFLFIFPPFLHDLDPEFQIYLSACLLLYLFSGDDADPLDSLSIFTDDDALLRVTFYKDNGLDEILTCLPFLKLFNFDCCGIRDFFSVKFENLFTNDFRGKEPFVVIGHVILRIKRLSFR